MGQRTCPVSLVGFDVLWWLRSVYIFFVFGKGCQKTFIIREEKKKKKSGTQIFFLLENLKRFSSECEESFTLVSLRRMQASLLHSLAEYLHRKITRKLVKEFLLVFIVYLNLSVKGTVNILFKEI